MKSLLILMTLVFQSIAQIILSNDTDVINIGAGSYATTFTQDQRKPSYNVYKTDNIKGALPTNKWWTNLLWDQQYSGELFPLPLCAQAKPEGLSIGYPNIVTNDRSIFGRYINDMTIGTTGSNSFPDTKLDEYGDWTITMVWQSNNTSIRATVGQGSPFAFIWFQNGNANITFPSVPKVWSGENSNIVGLTSNEHHYGIFAQTGTVWSGLGSTSIDNQDGNFITVALLPEATEKALRVFTKYAYNRVTSSKVHWNYDKQTSRVTTTFTVTTDPPGKKTVFGLFPHQWKHFYDMYFMNYCYQTIRGKVKTVIGKSFTTVLPYNGILPSLPLLTKRTNKGNSEFDLQTLKNHIQSVVNESYGDHFVRGQKDMYWAGKAFLRISTLVPIAKQTGNTETSNVFLDWLKKEISEYFVATDENGVRKRENYFYYDKFFGTLIGYPGFVESDTRLNNHNFHYGYWIKSCAEIAFNDHQWVAQWGPFVELLIKDVANSNRSDTSFPFMRSFDPYFGHSWASGYGTDEGSSGEATNAWSALILWGEATSNKIIRDLGIYLFTTEVSAIEQYNFNVERDVYPKEFLYDTIGLIFNGEFRYGSWISSSAEYIRGSNFLPMTPSSMYLGYHMEYVKYHLEQMKKEKGNSDAWEIWRELFWQYQSLADADGAIALYNSQTTYVPEEGESQAHTYSALYAMQGLGIPTNKVTANTTFYGVFIREFSKTYVAYNPNKFSITVRFSDGMSLQVEPNKLAVLI